MLSQKYLDRIGEILQSSSSLTAYDTINTALVGQDTDNLLKAIISQNETLEKHIKNRENLAFTDNEGNHYDIPYDVLYQHIDQHLMLYVGLTHLKYYKNILSPDERPPQIKPTQLANYIKDYNKYLYTAYNEEDTQEEEDSGMSFYEDWQ